MQKKVIALAVAALASTGALAQSNVQIYGVVDYGYAFRHDPNRVYELVGQTKDENGKVLQAGAWRKVNRNGAATVNSRIDAGQRNGNRLGFKGVEDLGNGLKAVFVLERGFNLDTGTDRNGFNRQAYMGLAGDWGTLAGGRIYTPYYSLVSSLDPFEDGTVGRYGNVKEDINGLFNPVRVDNTVAYISPNYNGFGFVAAYSNNAGGDDSANNNGANNTVYTVAANYTVDNAMLGLTYHHIGAGSTFRSLNPATGKTQGVKGIDNFTLGGSYDFGAAKVAAFWSWDELKGINGTNIAGTVSQKSSLSQNNFMLGATVPFGKQAVKASFNYSKNSSSQFGDAWQLAVGYDYNFSKRTTFYATYAYIDNDSASIHAWNHEGLAYKRIGRFAATGDASNSGDAYKQAFQLGVKHSF